MSHFQPPWGPTSRIAQSCPTLCDPLDCSPLVSSVRRIFQARILEWLAISYSRRSYQPRDPTWISCVSCIAGRFFICWAIRAWGPASDQKPGTLPSFCLSSLLGWEWAVSPAKQKLEGSCQAGSKLLRKLSQKLDCLLPGLFEVFSCLLWSHFLSNWSTGSVINVVNVNQGGGWGGSHSLLA